MYVMLIIGVLLSIPLTLAVVYRATFALTYLAHLLSGRHRPDPHPDCDGITFAALVPAHDEELLIGSAIDSIKACRYPKGLIDVYVVADNCSDSTADRARAHGAIVFERRDSEARGKGQALAWLIARLDLSRYQALAILDADCLVDPAFFVAMKREVLAGARILQGYYDISNPDSSSFTRLLSVTYVMKNLLFYAGKQLAGMSVALMGTGMVFQREVIERYGWEASSVAEDLEQSINLMEHGERIRFVSDARVKAQESRDLRTGYTQRQRWATGRRDLRKRAWGLLVSGVRTRSLAKADLGCELLLPPYSDLLNATIALLPLTWFVSARWPALLVGNLLLLAYQAIEVGVAFVLMGARAKDVLALVYAPAFLVWKAGIGILARFGVQRTTWIRTARSEHSERKE